MEATTKTVTTEYIVVTMERNDAEDILSALRQVESWVYIDYPVLNYLRSTLRDAVG